MKKTLYVLSVIVLFFCSCEKDGKVSDVTDKELTPEFIRISQNGKEVNLNDILQNRTIHLDQNKNYHIDIKFKQDVTLIAGEFLKFKDEGNSVFSADFYGKNLKEIHEIVTFRKEGYTDWKLNIDQKPLIPNYIVSFKGIGNNSDDNYSLNEGNNIIAITSTEPVNDEVLTYQMQLVFPSDIFIEDIEDGEESIIAEKIEAAKYKITIKSSKLSTQKDYVIKLPIYNLSDNKKGDRIGEIVFQGDFRPYIDKQKYGFTSEFRQTINYVRLSNSSYDNFNPKVVISEFKIQGRKANAIIENLNKEYFENLTYDEESGYTMDLKEDKREIKIKEPVKVFDLYEAELIDGKLVKKAGANKREIFCYR